MAVFDNDTRNKACDFVLQGGLTEPDLEALSCLTQGTDWIEDQNFSDIHKIVCGLSIKSLEDTILIRPEDLDSRDALGRTPLIGPRLGDMLLMLQFSCPMAQILMSLTISLLLPCHMPAIATMRSVCGYFLKQVPKPILKCQMGLLSARH